MIQAERREESVNMLAVVLRKCGTVVLAKRRGSVCLASWLTLALTAAHAADIAGGSDSKVTSNSRAAQQSMLIEAGQLLQMLNDPQLRILDARSRQEYVKGHVPGAAWVNVSDWKTLATADGGLHDADSWAKKMGAQGIGQDMRVVVYGGSVSDTARIWWLLKYVGVKEVSILDGGWDSWTKQHHPIETITPRIAMATFQPHFQSDRLEEIGTLKTSLGKANVKVVDTRSDAEFTGREIRGKRGGHIPGAVHLEWKELLAEDGRFKTRDELRTLFRKRGILPDETAVCY